MAEVDVEKLQILVEVQDHGLALQYPVALIVQLLRIPVAF